MSVDPKIVEEEVTHRLQKVIDPETGVDAVRMRLIEDLAVDETGTVSYRFRPSSPLCPLAVTLALQIYESLCNPVGQAMLLNKVGTELNIVVGLCMGHDSLFFKHSEAPVTVLVAKDRVTGHNPVAALYTSHSYYKRLR